MNGTRLITKKLLKNVIVATILTGVAEGEEVLIPRIGLLPSDFFVEFKRLQFPICPAFCLTINKAQGQTIKYTGLHLNLGVFGHAQLFVGYSRSGDPDKVYAYANGNWARNVVYKQVLQ